MYFNPHVAECVHNTRYTGTSYGDPILIQNNITIMTLQKRILSTMYKHNKAKNCSLWLAN